MDEIALTERLIAYDTSTAEGVRAAAEFVSGWLEARDLPVQEFEVKGLPVLTSMVGGERAPTVIFHGHLDVVPGRKEQFRARVEGDRLHGRGSYDMKGGLAAMMGAIQELKDQTDVRVGFCVVPDEESEEDSDRATEFLVRNGFSGDFAITGEPTDLHIGIQAKGVLAMRIEVAGTAAHGARPWLGDNAVLKAIDTFRSIESLPFARESSDLFDRASINLGRILGGDAHNKVPDTCMIDVEIRYLPGQDPEEILGQVVALADVEVIKHFYRPPAIVDRNDPFVHVLTECVSGFLDTEAVSVGRDGASDAISFITSGVPAVEFGPTGAGHHGPDEWVSIESLAFYRHALVEFVRLIPKRLERHLRIA